MEHTEQTVLYTQELGYTADGKEVLQDINIALEPGHIYGLLGRRDAGKTTLLRLLAGRIRPTTGKACLQNGKTVFARRSALRTVFYAQTLHTAAEYPESRLRVKEYLRMCAAFCPTWDKAFAAQLVERFILDEKERIATLRRDERVKLALTAALASRAPVTLLDDALAALDDGDRAGLYALLQKETTDGNRTFVLSTNMVEDADSVLTDVILLHRGCVLSACPVAELVGGFCYVSGETAAVDAACEGKAVINEETVGMGKVACVCAVPAEMEQQVQGGGVKVTPAGLKKIFVFLTTDADKEA